MNDVPSSHEPWDDVDALYRRVSALDPSRPSASVDSAILAHAAQVAAERSPDAGDSRATQRAQSRGDLKASLARARSRAWWRPAVFGTLAAAALAGLLVLPHALTPGVDRAPSPAPAAKQMAPAAPPAQTGTAMAPVAPVPVPGAPRAAKSRSASAATVPAPAPPATPTDAASATALTDARSEARVASAARRQRAQAEDKDQVAPPAYEDVTVTGQRRTQNDTAASPIAGQTTENSSTLEEAVVVSQPPGSPATLFQAAQTGDLHKLQAALDEHTDINSRDNTGATALLLATRNGRQQAVEMLLAKGADPNVADRAGLTPLMEATVGGRPAIVRALKRAGAH